MNIVVCIKAVPEASEVRFDKEKGTMVREGISLVINPYDLHSLEQGIRLKEVYGGEVIAISMGPSSVKEILREAIAMGAERAILLSDTHFAGSDTWATSFTLASAIKKLPKVDLILCGKQAIDGDTAQVGPGLSQNLDMPYVSFVRKIENIKDGKIRVERLIENGYEIIEMPLPGLLTVVKEINEPRFPRLKGKIKAKTSEIETWNSGFLGGDAKDYGRKGSPTRVIRVFKPEPRAKAEILQGASDEMVKTLIMRLKGKGVLPVKNV